MAGRTQKQDYTMRLHYSQDRAKLETSQCEKDMGVMVDNELKFSRYDEAQVAKANKILGLIRRSYQFLDKESLRLLFTALVRPHLECSMVAKIPERQKS